MSLKLPRAASGRAAAIFLAAFLAGCVAAPPAFQQPPDVIPREVPLEALNPDVRQSTIAATICVAGYTVTVRPSTTYTNAVKQKLLREAGISQDRAGVYELDHAVPLALGGHPRHLSNLVLQRWEGKTGAKAKDALERQLQLRVCAGQISLDEARRTIWFDWPAAYGRYVSAPETVPQ